MKYERVRVKEDFPLEKLRNSFSVIGLEQRDESPIP